MSNIDTVKEILRHMITPENPTHVQDIAYELADAGLLMPDLPAPFKPRAWLAGIADVRRINPREEEGGKVEVIVFHSNGRFCCSKEQARHLAYALLAAVNHAEEQQ